MRTKTLFLAAAFVAAGLASSMAQSNVYSLNIVGYYNIPITSQQTFCANSLNNGTPANRADQVVPYTDGDGLSIWNGVRFTSLTMDSGAGTGWADSGGSDVPLANLPILGPGVGWFYTRAGTVTNLTLVGEVPLGTNVVNLNLAQNAVGSPLPYSGLVSTGPIACPVADGDGVQTWNGAKFVLSSRDSGAGTGWANSGGGDVAEPSLAVGQGFFYSKVGGTVIWNQILNNP